MPMEIAAFVGEDGRTSNLYEKGRIVVYQRAQENWTEVREMEFCLDNTLGIKGMRMQLLDAIGFLEGCRSFVAKSVNGLPYLEFEKMGFNIWEYLGLPTEFLDMILQIEENDEKNKAEDDIPALPSPIEVSPGSFRISIKGIQENSLGYTSKQALIPFLRNKEFDRLEVDCSHVPPWLEAEIAAGVYSSEVNKGPTGSIITLIKSGDTVRKR